MKNDVTVIFVSIISITVLILRVVAVVSEDEAVLYKNHLSLRSKSQPSPVDDFKNNQEEIEVPANQKRPKASADLNSNDVATEQSTTDLFGTNGKQTNRTIDAAGTGEYGLLAEFPVLNQPYAPPLPAPHAPPVPLVPGKPIPPSIVHRDPHAHFNQHDQIRTQDHDRRHQLYSAPQEAGPQGFYGDDHGHGPPAHRIQGPPKPYHYDMQVVPECAHKNLYYYNLTFCLEDNHYPTDIIAWAVRQSGSFGQKLLADVTYQSADNLVDGLTKAEEEGYTHKHYYGGTHLQNDLFEGTPHNKYTYRPEYYKKGGYICPSNIYYARPLRAMNTYGKWKLIVNLDVIPKEYTTNYGLGHGHYKHETYTQTLRLEQCIYSNAPCSYIDPRVYSRCIQKHNFHRLIAWTQEEGLHVDIFKMPIACSCHIKQQVHLFQTGYGHHPSSHLRP